MQLNQSTRRIIVAFASLFKDIKFYKYDDNGNVIEEIKVPLVFADKEKYIKRNDGDPDEINKQIQITLPRFEYSLIDYQYDPSRKLNQANKLYGCSSDGSMYVNAPVPYNFFFELTLYTRNIEDANQIMENVLPFFNQDYNLKVNMVPEIPIVKSVPFILTDEDMNQDSTGVFDSAVRSVFRSLKFTAKSFIYPAPKYYKPILQAETYIYNSSYNNEYTISNLHGIFNVDDKVFQGSAYDRSSAKGIVNSINANSNTIVISTTSGQFKTNTTIKNVYNSANCILINENSNLTIKSIITPTPNTYPPIGPYEYNITITDY